MVAAKQDEKIKSIARPPAIGEPVNPSLRLGRLTHVYAR